MGMNNVYMAWFGDEIPEIRKSSIEQFEKVSETNVVLITNENMGDYILDSEPLHPAYECLSQMHRSDYMRTYFMNFHGGGYSDIKMTTGSWKSSFDKLNNSDAWAIGYKELSKRHVPFGGGARKHWRRIIGCSAFICKPQTEFTKHWYDRMISVLDKKLEQLKKFPARGCCDRWRGGNRRDRRAQYPLRHLDLIRHWHLSVCKHSSHMLNTLPKPNFDTYK
jgi:hypothetical protein